MKHLRIKTKDVTEIDPENTVTIPPCRIDVSGRALLGTRNLGEFARRSFWLNPDLDWHIGVDDNRELILLPVRRK